MDLKSRLEKFLRDPNPSQALRSLAAELAAEGLSREQVSAALEQVLRAVPPAEPADEALLQDK